MNFRDLVLLLSLKTSHCAKVFLRYWIAVFGAPNKVFSENGGEFVGEAFQEMCERFNIEIQPTLAYSPWSNGVCERHNQTLTTILLEIKDALNAIMRQLLRGHFQQKTLYRITMDTIPHSLFRGKSRIYQTLLKTICQHKNHLQNHSTSQHTLQLYMLLEKLLLNPSRVTN